MNVYDFDNTIYDGESFVDLFLMVLKKDPSVIRYAPSVLSGVIKYKTGRLDLEQGLKRYAPMFEDYVWKMTDLPEIIVEFWDTHICKIKPFYAKVRRDDDVIITASPTVVIEEIGRRLGITNYICSDIDPVSGRINRMCFKDNKVTAFKEAYPGVTIDTLYTDSMNDKPLMDISKHVVMVKGNKLTRIK